MGKTTDNSQSLMAKFLKLKRCFEQTNASERHDINYFSSLRRLRGFCPSSFTLTNILTLKTEDSKSLAQTVTFAENPEKMKLTIHV